MDVGRLDGSHNFRCRYTESRYQHYSQGWGQWELGMWCMLLTGMLTTFIYSKLWKRSGIQTDLEFYELRYSGPPAALVRGFRAIYLGVFFNCITMAAVMLAAIKISAVLLGASPIQTLLVAGTLTLFYTLLGGLRGVILTDFFQFVIAMIGSIAAAVAVCQLPQVGGLDSLLVNRKCGRKARNST